AVLAKEHAAVFVPGDHGSTFGGNPLTCAAAHATVRYVIDNDVPANARRIGAYLLDGLRDLQAKYGFISDVRGRGLLAAIEFDREIGQEALEACLAEGLLVNRVQPNALRFMPMLTIGEGEVDEALAIVDKALATLATE
ncbi:MAG: aminotransferase class III-fold pyridoxal phosphate-dependent enzyme, partial [Dehalococcoidales bacterium]